MNATYVVEIIAETYYIVPGEHTLATANAIAAYWRHQFNGRQIAVRVINLAFVHHGS